MKRPRELTRSEMKKELKEKKKRRKLAKPYGEDAFLCLKYWDKFRKKNVSIDERRECIQEMLDEVQGKLKFIAMKQDTSRVMETALKAGSEDQRAAIFNELSEHLIEISRCKYSRFVVKALVKYGPRERKNRIISIFQGNIRSLLSDKHASEIVEYLFTDVCNGKQRRQFQQEFYGQRFALIELSSEPRSLKEILEETPEKKDLIVSSMHQIMLPLIDKGTVVNSIVHAPLYECLIYSEYAEKLDLIERLKDFYLPIIETDSGSDVGICMIGYGRPKDRKFICKALKGYVVQIACHPQAYTNILKILTTVDDTVLVKKSVLNEVMENLDALCFDKHGKTIVLALISAPDSRNFTEKTLNRLEDEMIPSKDAKSMRVSHKKDQATLRGEHYNNVKEVLFEYIKQNVKFLLRDFHGRAILVEYLEMCPVEERTVLLKSILKNVGLDNDAEIPETIGEEDHSQEDDGHGDAMHNKIGHRVIKDLVKSMPEFADMLLEKISFDLKDYVKGSRSSWIVLALLENESTVSKTMNYLSKVQIVGKGNGTRLVLEKIKSLSE